MAISEAAVVALAIREEKRPPEVAAASYGADVARMLAAGAQFEPATICLYARIAAHFAARAITWSCPECGGQVERVRAEDGGCVEEPVMTPGGLRRKVRPATFYACTACEWCSEQPAAAWSADA